MRSLLFICTFLASQCSAQQESFIVKKKKKVSSSKLKENIGDNYGELLKKSSSLISSLSQLNGALVDRTDDLVRGSTCFVHSAKNGELESYCVDLDVLNIKLEQITADISDVTEALKNDTMLMLDEKKCVTIMPLHVAQQKKNNHTS